MHGPVQMIGLYSSIDCRNLYCAIITQACKPVFCKRCIFYAHNHKGRQAKLCTHTHTPRQTHTHIYIERGKHLHFLTVEKGRFSSQHRSSLSNPSVAEKEPSQPFLLNPLPSKSSARPRLRHTHSCFCHLRGHRFDSFLTLKDRFAQITKKNLMGFFIR